MRDVLSHHYFDPDAEVVHGVCKEKIPAMRSVIETMLNDLSNKG
ncbi:MAG: HepT-like ribonuclease domain-containing protein [Sedimenticola sp.]